MVLFSELTLNFSIHFELIFCMWSEIGSDFILLPVENQFSQYHLLRRLSLPCPAFLTPLLKVD